MKLSICMMVKNEEQNLERCLDSLKPIREAINTELIIVDTGSDDRTVEIAKRYTDKIFFHPWNNDFSEMRNISIGYANGEWILIIDADEEIEDYKEIIEFFESDLPSFYGAAIVTVVNVINSSDNNALLSPRFFKNDGFFRYKGSVHNLPQYKGEMIQLNTSFIHYGYIATDQRLMEKKFSRTSKLLLAELEKNPEDIYYRYQLSVTYKMHNDNYEALEEGIRAYKLISEKGLNPAAHLYIHQHLVLCYFVLGYYEEVENLCLEGIKIEPEYLDLYYFLAKAELNLLKYDHAKDHLMTYLDLAKNFENLSVRNKLNGITFYKIKEFEDAFTSLAYIAFISKDYKLAIEYIGNIKSSKFFKRNFKVLIKSYLNTDEYKTLKEYYESLLIRNDQELLEAFLENLEMCKLDLSIDKQLKIYKIFSTCQGHYAVLNQIRFLYNSDQNNNQISKLLTNFLIDQNLNNLPVYYGDIIYYALNLNLPFISLSCLTQYNLERFINYIYTKYKNSKIMFEEYLIHQDKKNNSIENEQFLKIVQKYYLLTTDRETKQFKKIFLDYLEKGIAYVKQIYNEDIVLLDNPWISGLKNEDAFFIYVNLGQQSKNDTEYVKYLKKALNIFPTMGDGIKILLSELESKWNELEAHGLEVKRLIETLINEGHLEEARDIIRNYEAIIAEDPEIISMKAIILMLENKVIEAKELLEEGLKQYPYNTDLLFNLSYINDQMNQKVKALECYTKAKIIDPVKNVYLNQIIISADTPVTESSMKVLHGTMELANQMQTMIEGLTELGVQAKSINYYPNYLGYKSDYVLNINSLKREEISKKTADLASKLIPEYNIFHFHFGTSLTLEHSDLPVLKELEKKVFMHHWGSDVRILSKAKELNPWVQVKTKDEEGIKRHLEHLSRYIKHCIVADYELYEYVRDWYDTVHFIPQCINLENYKPCTEKIKKEEKLLIVHAPTSPEIKGTKYILKAVEKLQQTYAFDFKLIQGMPHEKAKEIYQSADIIIDQVLLGSYGLLPIEGMAMGKPVICWISDYMKEKYPKELPLIPANPENITDVLENLIRNQDMLHEVGLRGRAYVEKYHDIRNISRKILELYSII